jgi:hypothetical protein
MEYLIPAVLYIYFATFMHHGIRQLVIKNTERERERVRERERNKDKQIIFSSQNGLS